MPCEPTPTDPRQSPYSGTTNPYTGKTAPTSAKTSPFGSILSPFSTGAYCPVLLYPEDGYPVLFDDGVTIEL